MMPGTFRSSYDQIVKKKYKFQIKTLQSPLGKCSSISSNCSYDFTFILFIFFNKVGFKFRSIYTQYIAWVAIMVIWVVLVDS